MRYFWIVVIAVSIVPTAIASVLLNPLAYVLLGPDTWREQLDRLFPYRWWIVASVAALTMATTVYGTRYTSRNGRQ